jgi:hypothetical protein
VLAAGTSAHGVALGGRRDLAPLRENRCVRARGRVGTPSGRRATSGSQVPRPGAVACGPAGRPGRRLSRGAAPGPTRETGLPDAEDRDKPPPTWGARSAIEIAIRGPTEHESGNPPLPSPLEATASVGRVRQALEDAPLISKMHRPEAVELFPGRHPLELGKPPYRDTTPPGASPAPGGPPAPRPGIDRPPACVPMAHLPGLPCPARGPPRGLMLITPRRGARPDTDGQICNSPSPPATVGPMLKRVISARRSSGLGAVSSAISR